MTFKIGNITVDSSLSTKKGGIELTIDDASAIWSERECTEFCDEVSATFGWRGIFTDTGRGVFVDSVRYELSNRIDEKTMTIVLEAIKRTIS